jgi:predicted ATPase/class 3 adenylate cyclase
MSGLPTGTVSFLLTDIEGSTRLLQEQGDRYGEALAEHRRRLRTAFVRHAGIEVDTQGDAFFYVFRSAMGAVAAAEEGQASLSDGPIRVRIGIHTCEPEVTAEGYVGIGLHRAARICSAAHGGQILLSERARSFLEGTPTITDLGMHRLKDLGRPEKLFQFGAGSFPPLRTLNATNLPAQTSPLFGRELELGDISRLVREHRLVTLTGPGGTGKTRLGLQVAAELANEFEDGVFWVPLAALTDPNLVLPTIAAVLGANVELATHIGEKRMLLLLDNLEQIRECAPAIANLLGECPRLKLLATSRAVLRLSGEREYQVPPLRDEDAITLFRDRAVQDGPLEVVQAICRRLDGLPLAIELAAARTRALSSEKLLDRLERRLPLLTGGPRDAPERQRTLRATIEWSYDLLSTEDRRLFARLGVMAGDFDIEASEVVCDADLDTLESLLEQSLLRRTEAGRMFYLEAIREFALEKLDRSIEAEEIMRRHAEYFLEVARSANLCIEDEGKMRHDIVIRDRENLRGALEWSAASGNAELGLQIAAALENYWTTNNPLEGKRWLGELLARVGDLGGEVYARVLRSYGGIASIFGEFDDSERAYEASLAAFRRLGDERGIAILLYRLALGPLRLGDLNRARALGEESLRLHRKTEFKRGEAQTLSFLARVELEEGRAELAIEMLERAAKLCIQTDFRWWRANVLLQLAELLLERGRLVEADEHVRDALQLAALMNDRRNIVYSLAILARLAVDAGQSTRAGRLWGAVETEEARAPLGHRPGLLASNWEADRHMYAEPVLAGAGPEFEFGRKQGRDLSLTAAVEAALNTPTSSL